MILALVIALIGFGLLFGFRPLLGGLLRGAIGVGLLLLGLSLLLQHCRAAVASSPYVAAGFGNQDFAIVYLVLAIVGWTLWKRRELRAKNEQARSRRDGKPRGRGLPAAPECDEEDEA